MDINKLFRRFASIFGNYKYKSLKNLFKKSYELLKIDQDENLSLKSNIKKMFMNVVTSSIIKKTGEKVGLVLKHCNENTFSANDLGRFIDQLKVEGYIVKLVFADYVDVMAASINRYSSYNDYDSQGQIVQELRALSRLYKLPVITASQNKREAENSMMEMNNNLIGDSIKKIRYSDFVYMCRMRKDLDIFSSPVKEHILEYNQIKNGLDNSTLSIRDQLSSKLVPFEVKITKAKESEKDQVVFLLFCKDNLKIYNNLYEYLQDSKKIEYNSKKLDNDIDLLSNMTMIDLDNNFDNFQKMSF